MMVGKPPRAVRTPGSLCREVFIDAPLAELAKPFSSALPLLPHHRPKSTASPRCKTTQHRRRLTVTEVSEPCPQVGRKLLDHLRQTDATGSTRRFPNPLLKASDGLGGDAPPRFSGKGTSGSPVRPNVPTRKPGANCFVVARKRGNSRGAKGAGHPSVRFGQRVTGGTLVLL